MKIIYSLLTIIAISATPSITFAVTPGQQIVADYTGVFVSPPKNVPTNSMPDGPLLGNGDVGVVSAGLPESQRFHIGKNDFWSRDTGGIKTVGAVTLSIPAMQGANYRQEQDMFRGEVRGRFTKGATTLNTRTWVHAAENLLMTTMRNDGPTPLAVTVGQIIGPMSAASSKITENANRLNIGREQHGEARWYFNGIIDDVRLYNVSLSANDVASLASGEALATTPVLSWPKNAPSVAQVHNSGGAAAGKVGQTIVFNGKSTYVDAAVQQMSTAVTVAAWIKISSTNTDANYIVSKGEWSKAYSLGLSAGCLRWAIGGAYLQSAQPLPLNQWLHVVGTFDGQQMCLYVDGSLQASLGAGSNEGTIDGKNILSFTRAADSSPSGRKVAVATRVFGTLPKATAGGLQLTINPNQEIGIATSIQSDLDSVDYFAAAKGRAGQMRSAEFDSLLAAHRNWWGDFWAKSYIQIPDKEIEKGWYAALYVMGSCSRAGKVAPGLWGNWGTTDSPNWHGDFHLNYNFQAPFYGVYSSNHAEMSLPFYQALLQAMPNGRAMAKNKGWQGIHFPVCIGPWGILPEEYQDWGQRSNAAYAALNFIWYYQYTQDRDFLRNVGYPYLIEVANFWENYLTYTGGRYLDYNDSIHENSGADTNPILSLGLIRTLFMNMIRMSKDLGVDANRQAKWQDILDKLSPFPLQQRTVNGATKTVFRYSETGMAWNNGNTLGIQHIFPAGAIGLSSDASTLQISKDTIDAMARWADYNGFSSWYTACARVGYDPTVILQKLRNECNNHSYPNLILYYGGGGIESCGGFLAINEMLLQSHDGTIRLFPCWPKNQNAKFGNLRAVGAFLVSAEMAGGTIGNVTIQSEKGCDCTVQNPWPGQTVQLVRNGRTAETLRGTFTTEPGEIIQLQPVATAAGSR